MSKEKRAPFSGKTPKKPEYVEPPTVTVDSTPVEMPPKQMPLEVKPTTGIVTQQKDGLDLGRIFAPSPELVEIPLPKELPTTHLDKDHSFVHSLAVRHTPANIPVIRGRGTTPTELPKEKPVTESTTPEMTGQKKTPIDRWTNIPLTTPTSTLVETGERATGYKLLPKDEKDAEHKET